MRARISGQVEGGLPPPRTAAGRSASVGAATCPSSSSPPSFQRSQGRRMFRISGRWSCSHLDPGLPSCLGHLGGPLHGPCTNLRSLPPLKVTERTRFLSAPHPSTGVYAEAADWSRPRHQKVKMQGITGVSPAPLHCLKGRKIQAK